ncbi:MAG: mechanosensitive ion channel family protein [Deltaproteobacteria bacterium]|nr:mechanosensitive ion channel family protein [Deltaproteobacteria bacterium]MBN2673842.1 mechanosensitive ion channel family protein [Deltaproteobacteria bacterium]
MESILIFFQMKLLGIAVWIYFAALGAILAGFIGKKLSSIIFARLLKLTEKTTVEFDDIFISALSKPVEWAVSLGGIFVALLVLPLPSEPVNINKFVTAIISSTALILIVWFCTRLVDGIADWWGKKAEQTESRLDDQLVPIVRKSLKAFLYVIGVVLILQNLGYSVGSLLAGLGIGGLAMAMAAKDTVANLFGSVVIFLDKPFQVGDWIETANVEGTVEEIGLRTTRIRTFANSLITIPNSTFTTNPVNNWSQMKKRRIKMTIGVTYSTSSAKMGELVKEIRRLIADNPKIKNDFYLVNFDNFGPSSLDVFIYCFTETTNWGEFLQTKEEFLLTIMDKVESLGLNFAFPTQSVHLASVPEEITALTSQRPR